MATDLQIIFNDILSDASSLQDLCRLCGNYNMSMFSIFDNTSQYDFLKIINLHFHSFSITDTDLLPLKICLGCVTSLTSWHEFYTKCLDVNKRFETIREKLSSIIAANKIKNEAVNQDNLPLIDFELKRSNSDISIHDQIDGMEDTPDIEVIEIKVNGDESMENEDEYDDSSYTEEVYDIANIHMHDDLPKLQISETTDKVDNKITDDSIQEEKRKTEEFTISENDLNIESDPLVCVIEKSETVEQPSRKVEKLNKFKKSTVCRVCGKLYVTRTSYLRHLLKQHSNHTLSKQNANNSLAEKSIAKKSVAKKMQMNRTAPKEDEARTMCDACGKTFRFRSSYRKHVRDQHSEDDPKPKQKRSRRMCDLCGKICSGGSFKGHMRKHTNPETVTCEHCGQVFSFVSVLKSHIKVRHSNDRPYKCETCDSTFKRADYLRSHMRYKHEPKLLRSEDKIQPYRCDDCDSTFKNKESLEKHRTLKTGNESDRRCPATFQCDVCESTFKKRNYLILHKRYVHDERRPFRISEASVGPYKCDKCERRFASVCGRNYHCKSVHGTVFDTKFSETCDHCGLTFRNRVFYAKHCAKLRDKPTCYLCWNAFDDPDSLKEHMHEVHVDDLPFLCELCRSRFVTLRQLNDHIRSRHAKIRPFKCGYCKHTSVRKDSLEVHIRSCHLGHKPYKCDLCEKAFSQSSDLRKHRVIHTRTKVITVKSETPS